jgi:ABC-type sugar transport system substrate-binding protein
VVHFWRWVWSGPLPGRSLLFLNPGTPVELFWTSYSQFMQAAADDLHIDLRILYSNRPEVVIAQAREALLGPHRPDYLIFVNEESVAPEILRLAKGSGVKLFMVNSALSRSDALLGARPDKIGWAAWCPTTRRAAT